MRTIQEIVGKVLIKIEGLVVNSEKVVLYFNDNTQMEFEHKQDCCEEVYLLDYICDPTLIKPTVVLSAEERTSNNISCPVTCLGKRDDSNTWTFYTINTTTGEIFMRWYGSSNGYYSEEVHYKLIQSQ